MSALPLVRGTAQALYPLKRTIAFDTLVSISANGSEQRSPRCGVPLFRLAFQYQNLSYADLGNLQTFFAGEKGMFASNWQVTLGSTVFANLTFDQDIIEFIEQRPKLYQCALQFRQVQNRAYTIPSALSAFPSLANVTITQLPFSQMFRNVTATGTSPSGANYSYSFYASSLTNYPTRPLRRWKLSYAALSDADLATLENAFVGWQGRYAGFSFTDPDSTTTYAHCRLDQDSMEINYQGPGQAGASLIVTETNN